jgi:hypothetical protein
MLAPLFDGLLGTKQTATNANEHRPQEPPGTDVGMTFRLIVNAILLTEKMCVSLGWRRQDK